MNRYVLHLSYNGTFYHGWQRQKQEVKTVQQTIEEVLTILCRRPISIIGCGRTDKGVHARSFYAHFDIDILPKNLLYKMNKILPDDITIYSMESAESNFHARFAAKTRTYKYYFHITEDPFIAEVSSFYDFPNFNISLVHSAVSLLIANKNFASFCKVPEKHDGLICKIISTSLIELENGQYVFELSANRFLRGMIRILMFDLLEIGRGKLSIEDFQSRLNGSPRKDAVQFAYPQGLFLEEVIY